MSSKRFLCQHAACYCLKFGFFFDSYVPQTPITPSQQGTQEMKEEVLSSAGAQNVDTRGYELSDLDDIDLFWEKPQSEVDAVFRPGIGPISSRGFDILE